jgi:hypothetical protein
MEKTKSQLLGEERIDSERIDSMIDPHSRYTQYGLTKRQYFAGIAMQGFCGGEFTGQSGMPVESIAKWSVTMADALLEELVK